MGNGCMFTYMQKVASTSDIMDVSHHHEDVVIRAMRKLNISYYNLCNDCREVRMRNEQC